MPAADAPSRPPIVGVAHIGLRTDNLEAARKFYGQELGYQEAFTLDKPSGGLMLTYFKVNDHQYIEVFPNLERPDQDRLSHIAFETTNIQQLRDYLASRAVKVPDTLKPGLDGNVSFMIKDPDGHDVEFVQYMPGSLHEKNFGKFLPATRVSDRIIHVGATVQDRARGRPSLQRSPRLPRDLARRHEGRPHGLGRYARSRRHGLVRVHAQRAQPESEDARSHEPPGARRAERRGGTQDGHGRGLKPEEPKIGRDGKWQLNLYDPNFTRAELMEPKPVETPCCSPFLE